MKNGKFPSVVLWRLVLMAGMLAVAMPVASASQHTNAAKYWESQMRLLLTLPAKSYAIGDRKVTRDEAVVYVFARWQRAIRNNQNVAVSHAAQISHE